MSDSQLIKKVQGDSTVHEHPFVEKRKHPNEVVGSGVYVNSPTGLKEGDVIFHIISKGQDVVTMPDRGTIQTDHGVHVKSDGWLWGFLNHSCDPNVTISDIIVRRRRKPTDDTTSNTALAQEGRQVMNTEIEEAEFKMRLVKPVGLDGELTFNYLTTEYSMDAPFQCNCSSSKCFGAIMGLKHAQLDKQQLKELEPLTASYLKDTLNSKIHNVDTQ